LIEKVAEVSDGSSQDLRDRRRNIICMAKPLLNNSQLIMGQALRIHLLSEFGMVPSD
jgi:hypothetical protein